ncbi:MAG TPA: hypothetical protein RMH85_26155 [Polyangiaceae bacterium LLY-WYZ-15_(1-7)]|nr:hypothetical protein [Polyangiaceae bacterium LLY-WYZ-15_(1-7)]HJL11986.1 hypothetical protein [Polyangiaceae bacterium LLY-WYZ-15_(1-7)]HJL21843.1 hypothetical protein [Polyangiaceae bacterium LLY-WYZ-15_(1-7)]HJL31359.1 hypothetical protein [Polyangiaceae bacterium LLY-WYZ-15_(1-7)]
MPHPFRPRFALLLLLAACGSRTPLGTGTPPADAGPDAMPPPPLAVDCGRSVQYTAPRQPITLEATVESETPIAFSGWSLEAQPPGAMAGLDPTTGPTATLRQSLAGDYLLRFTARDAEGREESCQVRVESIVGPPRAICPEDELRTPSNVPLTIEGDGFDDVGVVSYRWAVLDGPGDAALAPRNAPTTVFRAERTGTYRLELTVADADMATHSCVTTVRVVGPPAVFCPDPIEAPTRRPVTLEVRATDDTRIVDVRWELLAQPPESRARVVPGEREGDVYSATLTPDRQGEYVVRFTAIDEDGLEASCELLVIGTPTPPDAICPDVVEVRPLNEATIEGDAEDDGRIVRWRWELIERAEGSEARPPAPADAPTTRFTPDIAGEYRVRLTVRDDDGDEGSCVTLVRAVATEGLRVEMFWDTDGTDMDLHLLRAGGDRWRTNEDCYYVNCIGRGPDWGGPGAEDNPRLDIDNTSGFGPENINIEEPEPGVYRIGVYAYRGTARGATVRVHCGGSTTEPQEIFGPRRIDGTGSTHDFWRVADVRIEAGRRCSIEPVDRVERVQHDGSPFPR